MNFERLNAFNNQTTVGKETEREKKREKKTRNLRQTERKREREQSFKVKASGNAVPNRSLFLYS